jgi:FkbM family methyltransferase
MIYKFIDIGTCDEADFYHLYGEEDAGVLVEPLKENLDRIPDRKNVIKINSAISRTNEEGEVSYFYVEEAGLRGCGAIEQVPYEYKRLNLQDYKEINVQKISLQTMMDQIDYSGTEIFKIDAEGCDLDIMLQLHDYLKDKPRSAYPEIIIFEYWFEQFRNDQKYTEVIDKFSLNYKDPISLQENVLLRLNGSNAFESVMEKYVKLTGTVPVFRNA